MFTKSIEIEWFLKKKHILKAHLKGMQLSQIYKKVHVHSHNYFI